MNNRLQLVHCSKGIFDSREKAVEYVKHIQPIERPSLLAEPMVMLYKNKDDESSPNVILAIGTVGDGVTYTNDNRTFFIDTQKTEEELVALEDELAKVARALTLYVEDTNTIDLSIAKGETGTTINANAVLSDFEIFSDEIHERVQRDNILRATNKGLFTFVNLEYNKDKNEFKFFVNDKISTFTLPTETYVNRGDYDIKTECIRLYHNTDKNSENPILIDVNNLIEEWKVEEGESKTPIVLTRERVYNEEEGHKFQDILKGDIRIYNDKSVSNIIERTEDGKALYVRGVADNIKYGEVSNVKEQLDRLNSDVRIANTKDNIIIRRELDGLYASVDLDYDPTTNTLKFKTTKDADYRDIQLNGVDIFTAIWYDATTEELNLQWKDSNGELQVIKIAISDMFEEWVVLNDEHTVRLEKTRSKEGKTTLIADVNIATNLPNNILQEIPNDLKGPHSLYVNGVSENIKYGETSTVRKELDQLNERMDEKDSQIDSINSAIGIISGDVASNKEAIENEIATRTEQVNVLSGAIDSNSDEIERLDTTIGTGFTTDAHETVTYKFEQEIQARIDGDNNLQNSVNQLTSDLEAEVDTRKEQFEALHQLATTNRDKIGTGFTTDEHDNITYKFEQEVQARINGDNSLNEKIVELSGKSINFVEDTDSVRMSKTGDVIKSDVKLCGREDNILDIVKDNTGDGVYASVDVLYDGQTNKLTLVTNKGQKELQLIGVTAFDEIRYNPLTETVDIKATGIDEMIRIPVGALIQEWEVQNEVNSPVVLSLSKHVVDGKDALSANVKVSTKEDNIFEVKDGALYVSNSAITTNTNEISTIYKTIGDKFGVENNQTISYYVDKEIADRTAEIARLDNELSNTLDALSYEIATRSEQVVALSGAIDSNSSDIDTIDNTIGTGFTSDPHDNITYKFEKETQERIDGDNDLQNKIDDLNGSFTEEINSCKEDIAELRVDVDTNTSTNERLDATIGSGFTSNPYESVTAKFQEETISRINEDTRLQSEIDTTNSALENEVQTRVEQVNTLTESVSNNTEGVSTINATIGTGFTTDAHETITYKFTQEESERKIEDIRLQDEIDKTNQVVSDLDVKHNTDIFGINSRLTTTEEDVAIISKKLGSNFGVENNQTVSYYVDTLSNGLGQEVRDRIDGDNAIKDKLNNEIDARVVTTELANTLDTKLGDGFSTNETGTVTYKFNKETEERISEDNKLKEAINELGSTSVLSVDDSNTVQFVKNGTVLTANAKIASESGNILQAKVDGLYTSVDVSYDKNTNELVTSINGETKKTRINGVLNIATPVYDPATESLTINFVKTDGTNDKVVVNLSDLASSFEIKNETSSAVKLQLSEHKVDGKDILSAKVDIVSQDVHPDNILVNDGGALYVSNSSIVSNTNEIKAINEKIGNSFSKNNTISDAVIRIENELASSTGDLNDDIDKLKKSDEAQSANIDANTDAIATINGKLGDTFTSTNTVSKAIADLDTLIGQSVENLANADNALNERINTEKIDVNAKIEALKTADADIKTLISEQVNSLNAKDAEIVGQINAESTRARSEEEKITSVVAEFKDSIERSIGGVQANLTSESDRAKEEETKLSTAITSLVTSTGNDHEALLTETNARKQDRRELEVLIEKSKPTVEDTQTIDLTLTDANVIKGEVLISNSEENIIKASQSDERGSGLYATVNLGYDAAKNALIFSASGKGEKEIQLNAGSIIDGIDYDSNTKELVIRYRSTSGGDQLQTRVAVGDLINDWNVEGVDDEGNYSGAIALHKVRLEDGSYKLSGRVQVSTLPSNLLVNDNGNLYVNGETVEEAKDIANAVSGVVDTLKEDYSETKEKVGNIINGVRLTNEGNFDTSLLVGTNYISGATNVMEALRMMDQALKNKLDEVDKMLETVLQGSDTYSINLEKGTGTGEYDMRLYGNLRLAKSKFGGEQTEVEYSDAEMQTRGKLTNLLKVVHQENNVASSPSNGLFYDGSVDYGTFDGNGIIDYDIDYSGGDENNNEND